MKKFILAVLVLGIILTLCACGGNQQASSDGTVSQQETKTENTDDMTTKNEKADLTPIALGDKITVDFAEITVDECGIKEDLKTSIKTGNITYTTGPESVSGSKFVYMRGTIKNTSKSEISWAEIGGQAEIDGYSYNVESIDIIEENGSSAHNLAPLITYKYTLYAKVPNELADSYQSCVLNIGFDDNFARDSQKEVSEYKYGYTLKIQPNENE